MGLRLQHLNIIFSQSYNMKELNKLYNIKVTQEKHGAFQDLIKQMENCRLSMRRADMETKLMR